MKMNQQPLFTLGILLIVAGVLIVATLLAFSWSGRAEVKGGGVIMIGPFPIIFGSDSGLLAILAVVAILFVAVYLVVSTIGFG